MGTLIRSLIRKLYFRYCFKKERFAQEIVFYLLPGKFHKQQCSVILAQLEEKLNNPVPYTGFRALALGPLEELSTEGEVKIAEELWH